MRKLVFISLSCLILTACFPAKKVAKFDHQTGAIQLEPGKKLGSATIVKNTKTDLSTFKDMAFFSSNQFYYDYGFNQLNEIGYFKTVSKFADLEKLVIANNLQDKVINLDSQIGLSRLAKYYKPFLWVRLVSDTENNVQYTKLIVTNPANAEDLFEAKTLSSGSTDEQVLYPLFNELSAWLRSN